MEAQGFARSHSVTSASCFQYVCETDLPHDLALSRVQQIVSGFGKRFVILVNNADGSKRSGSFG